MNEEEEMSDSERDETKATFEDDPDLAVSTAELDELRTALREVGPAPVDEVTRRRQISAALAAVAGSADTETEGDGESHVAGPVAVIGGRQRRVLVGVFAAAAVLAALALVVTRIGDSRSGGPGGTPLATSGSGSARVFDLGDLGRVDDAATLAAQAVPATDTPRRPLAGPAARCATELAEDGVASDEVVAVGNASYAGERVLVLVYADGTALGVDTDCAVRLGTH